MSRIGRLPIPVPAGVDISVEGATVSVKGPKGSLSREIAPQLTIVREDGTLRVERPDDGKQSRELHGLTGKLHRSASRVDSQLARLDRLILQRTLAR